MKAYPQKTTLMLIVFILCYGKVEGANIGEEFSSSRLVAEVISHSDHPHAYDWRKNEFDLALSWVLVSERNNFESQGVQLAFQIPTNAGYLIRIGLRRIHVAETSSSKMLGRTPFKQSALMKRYELFSHLGYNVLEGRSISRLSISDLEQVFWVLGGFLYSHPNQGWVPKKSDKPEAYLGQDQVNSKIVLNLGLLWQIYIPDVVGISWEWVYHYPVGNTGDLQSWNSWALGLVYSFGAD